MMNSNLVWNLHFQKSCFFFCFLCSLSCYQFTLFSDKVMNVFSVIYKFGPTIHSRADVKQEKMYERSIESIILLQLQTIP